MCAVKRTDMREAPYCGLGHAGYSYGLYIVMVCIGMAYTVMAYVVMAYIGMAHIFYGYGLCQGTVGGFLHAREGPTTGIGT